MRNAVAIEVSRARQRGYESYPGPRVGVWELDIVGSVT